MKRETLVECELLLSDREYRDILATDAEVKRLRRENRTLRAWAERADHFPLCPGGYGEDEKCSCGKAAALKPRRK